MSTTAEPGPARVLAAVLLIAACGAWLRTAEMDALLPQMLEPDAVYVRQALELRAEREQRGAAASELSRTYPLLLPWMLSWFPLEPAAPPADAPLARHLEAAAAPWLWGRRLVAWIAIGVVPATFLLARMLLSRGAALLASALAASSLVLCLYAQQARPHAAFATLATLALVALLQLRRSGSVAAHLGAGAAIALALACLHTGAFLIPALVAALVLARGRRPLRALAALALPALALAAAYPGLWGSAGVGSDGVLAFDGHRVPLARFGGRGFLLAPPLVWSFEPILCVLLGSGVGVALARIARRRPLVERERRGDLALLAAFCVPLALVIGGFDQPWEKYWLPLVPPACVFAAAAAERVARALRLPPGARVAAALALLALPATASARLALLRTSPDSTERAAAWLEGHVERGSARVLTDAWLSLPLARRPPEPDPVPDWALAPWDAWQRAHPELARRTDAWDLRHLYLPSDAAAHGRPRLEREALIAALRELDADWIVLERRGTWQVPDDGTRAAVEAVGGSLAVRFEPYDPDVVTLDSRGWVLGGQAVLRALTARYAGPRIEIWRLGGER